MKKVLILIVVLMLLPFWAFAALTDTAWTRQILGEDILDVKFSPDGSMIATGHEDPENKSKAKIRLWDTQTGEVLKELETGTSFTTCLVFSDDGSYLFSGHEKGRLFRWDMQTFEKSENLLANYPDYLHPNSVAITSLVYSDLNSKLIVGTTQNNNGSTNPNNILYLDELTGQIIKDLKLKGSVSKLIINKDENYFAAKSTFYQNPTRYYQVTLFDLNTFEEIKVLDDTPDEISDIAFSADGTKLYEVQSFKSLTIWSIPDANILKTFKPKNMKTIFKTGIFQNMSSIFILYLSQENNGFYGKYDTDADIIHYTYSLQPFSQLATISIAKDDSKIAIGNSDRLHVLNGETTSTNSDKFPYNDSLILNPMNDTVKMIINIPTSGQIKFILSDMNGLGIGTILENYFEAGNHEIDIQLPNLPSGNYFLTVNGEKYSKTLKLTIVK